MPRFDFRMLYHGFGKLELGESPFWDPESNDLWWVDITGKKIFRADTVTGGVEAWDAPEYIGFVVLTSSGRPAVGMQSGIYEFEPNENAFTQLVPFNQAGCRFNDATIDQTGRLWVSTMDLEARPECGAVHLVTQDMSLHTVVDRLTIPNGLALDLEHDRLFYSDSYPPVQTVWERRLTPTPELLGEPTLFTDTLELAGRPDGAALDAQGFYWIAGVDGAELYIFDLDGKLFDTIPVPFEFPTKVSFAGPDGSVIAVTSKVDAKDGGNIALAKIPADMTPGTVQPCWKPGL